MEGYKEQKQIISIESSLYQQSRIRRGTHNLYSYSLLSDLLSVALYSTIYLLFLVIIFIYLFLLLCLYFCVQCKVEYKQLVRVLLTMLIMILPILDFVFEKFKNAEIMKNKRMA